MTGRAAGYCAGYPVPGFMNPIGGGGFGFGRGRGFGRGLGLGFRGGRGWAGYGGASYGAPGYGYGAPYSYGASPVPYGGASYGYGAASVPYGAPAGVPYGAPPTSQQEVDALKGQSEYLEDALEGIKKRIVELGAATEEKK